VLIANVTYPEGFPRERFVSHSTFQFPLPTKHTAERGLTSV